MGNMNLTWECINLTICYSFVVMLLKHNNCTWSFTWTKLTLIQTPIKLARVLLKCIFNMPCIMIIVHYAMPCLFTVLLCFFPDLLLLLESDNDTDFEGTLPGY